MIRPIKKRGVSPVIASVLLIGMVVVIGLIIFLWLRGLTQEAVVKFDKNVELVCADLKFDTEYSGNKLTVSNIGNVAIYEIKVKMIQDKSFDTQNIKTLTSKWPSAGLNPGRVFSENININAGIDSLVIIPVLIESRFGREIIL